MEEAEGLIGVPVLHAEAGADDADDVGGDGDRNAGESKNDAAFRGALEEVAVEDCQGEQAHQGANAAAGLGDLQFHDRQFDDIAFVERGNAQQWENVAGDS